MKGLLFLSLVLSLVHASEQGCSPSKDNRVYTFAFGNDWKPYEFINEDGELMGISYDIVRRVCEKACKKCAYIVFNDYKTCWDLDTMQSKGLNNRFWDVCVGWVVTNPRQLVYSLFAPLTNEASSSLYVRQASDIRTFDPSSHKIGIRQSFRTNEKCLKALKGWEVENVSKYPSWDAIVNDVLNNNIDVGFVEDSVAMGNNRLRKVSDSMTCGLAGPSLMTRKDVAADYAWFTKYLQEIQNSAYYSWICNIAKRAYGGDPHCTIKP